MSETAFFALHDDGTITIPCNTVTLHLRRPTLGEFRSFRFALAKMNDETRDSRLRALQAGEVDSEDENLDAADLARRQAERREAHETLSEDKAVQWWQHVLETLAEGEVPPADDWPPFIIFSDDTMAKCLNHWRAVPLAPGSNGQVTSIETVAL